MKQFSETRTKFLIRKLEHFLGIPVTGGNLREVFPFLTDREVAQTLSYKTNGMPDHMMATFVVVDKATQETVDWLMDYDELTELHKSLPTEEREKLEFWMTESVDPDETPE